MRHWDWLFIIVIALIISFFGVIIWYSIKEGNKRKIICEQLIKETNSPATLAAYNEFCTRY